MSVALEKEIAGQKAQPAIRAPGLPAWRVGSFVLGVGVWTNQAGPTPTNASIGPRGTQCVFT